ncbi:HNH endonuclease signature motif containing protein [Corynebacterium pelargi]|uniref:HNH endonuclease n=1 Tax=Corynebacterium pelargi TaxID=1471400 RepID=A0A410W812_9CORY|nr:HNH endonuclease signature motif containing protein [Corynebacterium pelargi]QAU52095.1 HNH endonuclease [Corynebacterium pelargi]
MGNFRHQQPSDAGEFQRRINELNIEFWTAQHPVDSADFHTQLDRIASEMNISRHEVRIGMRVGVMLRRFERFAQCIREHGYHINMAKLSTVEQHVVAIQAEHQPQVEQFLVEYFTPNVDDEVLPQPATIAKHLRSFIATIDERAAKTPRGNQQRRARFIRNHNGTTRFSANLSDVEAAKLQAVLKKEQRDGMELVDAFAKAIDSRTITKVHLHLFKDPAGVHHLLGSGPLFDAPALVAKATPHEIDAQASTAEYRPTPEIRKTVQLLDGTCRYPGCSRPAQECDLDHVINFDEGGPTEPSNLACLCRFHHTMKTSGRVHYTLHKDRTITWYFGENTKTTKPHGEAIPRAMFSQTWAEHENKRIKLRRSA